MPTYEQNKASAKRYKSKFEVLHTNVPKGMKEKIEYRAYESGHVSMTAYICHLIRDDMGMSLQEWKKAGE